MSQQTHVFTASHRTAANPTSISEPWRNSSPIRSKRADHRKQNQRGVASQRELVEPISVSEPSEESRPMAIERATTRQ